MSHPSQQLLTTGTLIERAGKIYGKRTAILDDEATLTYGQYVDRIARAAAVLEKMGVKPGQRFGIISRNSFRHAELINAGYWLGAVPVPVNFRLALPEIQYILEDADCQVLAVEDKFIHLLEEDALSRWQDKVLHISPTPVTDDSLPWPQYEIELLSAEPKAVYQAAQDDDAILLYTGGTTGRSKGVRLSHSNVISNCIQMALTTRAHEADVYLHMAPMFHSADLLGNVFTLMGGAHVYLQEFSTTNFLRHLQDFKVTFSMMPPTIIILLLQEPTLDDYDLSHLRQIFYGSAPLDAEWIKRLMARFPDVDLQQSYGLTETAPILTTLSPTQNREAMASGNEKLLRSVGIPVPHVEIRIVDEHDNEVPVGETGEVVVRGPNVTKGYLGMDELNAQVFRGGWFHTGDVGCLDEDNKLYLMDRKKDMIITGSENVYSLEVEVAIYKHPDVSEVAVVGVPDKKWGEAVFAAIVPRAGATLTEAQIIEHCRQHIGGYKIPRRMAFMDTLPKTAMGKIQKTELRRMYSE